ncbi:hypothetical protein BCR42DRAFT_159556 [Absidia repens]|uniref:Heterokaryon incompatibility domain-containing protein n=1 Tax=Absidia repens TaxID=90262 RepID=A0A1X2HZZ4_9FUNG|nr:hypothetical protein BCR42DRAFT_159556 [Absidia repens]
MTNDNQTERCFRELTYDNIQPQQQQQQQQQNIPFQIVLVDIEEASRYSIHCVEIPLEDASFVALSYRRGELDEAIVDTGLGYTISMTSFGMYDFYTLCKMILQEPDLKHIKYVWVDAICVNRSNYEQRKATLHHMSDIYEQATYILAVPDLHKRQLRNTSTANQKIMNKGNVFSDYIYYLMHENSEQLNRLDNQFLDNIKAPADRTLRQLLANYTTFLADGFTQCREKQDDDHDPPENALDLLCEIHQASSLPNPHESLDLLKNQTQKVEGEIGRDGGGGNESWLHYDKVASLFLEAPDRRWKNIGQSDKCWTHALIHRKTVIRQVMQFLADLIADWSTRVWVVSEYTIAKKKNNLKYWFMQLSNQTTKGLPFFTYDFTNPAFAGAIEMMPNYNLKDDSNPNPLHRLFHHTMSKQLHTQTFFEMMLRSKATKNEDRFYAILPLSKYVDKLKQVDGWKFKTLMSVKCKLFDIMDTRDKWNLLFLSAVIYFSNGVDVLPTFCPSKIVWEAAVLYVTDKKPCNLRLNGDDLGITLRQNHDLHLYYLQFTPKEYYAQLH